MIYLAVIAVALIAVQWWMIRRLKRRLNLERKVVIFLRQWIAKLQQFGFRLIIANKRLRRKLKIASEDVAKRELTEEDSGDWWKTENRPFGDAG